jgi:imidazolonepropionase-like amidohydrolase
MARRPEGDTDVAAASGYYAFVLKSIASFAALGLLPALAAAQQRPLVIEHGVYQVHLLLHTIGTEEYTITDTHDGRRVLTTTTSTNDRGMKRTSVSTLTFGDHFEPLKLEQKSGDVVSTTEISGIKATVREGAETRTFAQRPVSFVGFASMPAAMQMMMMRYWQYHHSPAHLPIVRASDQAPPLDIKLVGHESFQIKGKMVHLTRYTVANLMFGREILWMDDSYRAAAIMTFAGGLPQEFVLDEYESATGNLARSGVRQEMLDLAEIDSQVTPEAQGAYAIVGARLIDGSGAAPVEQATVVVRDGRIVSAGSAPPPAGMRVVYAEGKSLLPGLWEMHSHFSGVEFGPALLAAGVTTARDCGGEIDFLVTIRDAITKQHVLGPRLLLAGLIDAGGPLGFGVVDAETRAEGVAAVDFYAQHHFQQIKVYTQLQPDVLRAIAAEAHAKGMTVTGHVPAAVDTFEGIADGMDQVNHLQFITRSMLPPNASPDAEPDLNSGRAQRLIALLKEKQIVVDPTAGWGEMAGHPKTIDAASFEPGVNAAPFPTAAKFRNMGTATDAAKFHARMEVDLRVIDALHKAGVPIVAGSDTGLIGYGLARELELYVQAGMTPMAAIQTATLNAARAMHLDAESGTIQPGKRADLVLVDGNPLANISDIRRVSKVITEGRMYDSKELGHTVGFNR